MSPSVPTEARTTRMGQASRGRGRALELIIPSSCDWPAAEETVLFDHYTFGPRVRGMLGRRIWVAWAGWEHGSSIRPGLFRGGPLASGNCCIPKVESQS